jgi:hypothetical protein
MVETLDEFITSYRNICNEGWKKTHRSGDTGIGKTLEDLLDITENNKDQPDFGEYELKSARINSNSMLTLFTKTPKPRGAAKNLRDNFGYYRDGNPNNEKILHTTLSTENFVMIADTGKQLKIHYESNKISIIDNNQEEYGYWFIEDLQQAFERKYKNKLVYARAQSRGAGSQEEFKYTDAYILSGFDYNTFVSLIEQGKIYIDLRIGQYPDGRTHDHGTAFRIKEKDRPKLFKIKKQIV